MEGAARIVGLNHIGITVSSLDRAVRFFRDMLGATVGEATVQREPFLGRTIGVPGAANIVRQAVIGDYRFELLEYIAPPDRRSSDLRPCDAGHIHLALTVEGIDAIVERMRAAGFAPVGPVERNLGSVGLAAVYTCGFDTLIVELIDYCR